MAAGAAFDFVGGKQTFAAAQQGFSDAAKADLGSDNYRIVCFMGTSSGNLSFAATAN